MSPDGRYVAYLGNRDPDDPKLWRDVYVADVQRRTTRRLTDDPAVERDVDWERSGRALLVVTDEAIR